MKMPVSRSPRRRTTDPTNPYRSPAHLSAADGFPVFPWRPGTRAELIAQRLLYRKIQILAPIEAVLEFHGRSLFDRVLIDGQVVASRFSWWRITPRLEFPVATDRGVMLGRVELRVWPWLQLRRFRVILDGQELYREG